MLDRRTLLATTLGSTLVVPGVRGAATPAPPSLPSPKQPVAETVSGHVRGIARDGVRAFKGIPYGASTAGANRFQPPQPAPRWSGVLDALAFGPQCPVAPASSLDAPFVQGPQDAFLLYRGYLPHVSHEDCLRLNVWTPEGQGRRPVMVYMHGGGFFAGSGHDLLAYDGENLARRGDVVVVTHSHRLNLFGYLDLSDFGGRWRRSANVGMQDIVAVLEWVRDNAAAFGGDPSNVTIFGQSGGGGKVLALMAMPAAQGLFQKAIVQSGTIPGFGMASREEGRLLTREVLRNLDFGDKDLDRLADLPTDRLCQAAAAVGSPLRWAPVVDGEVLPAAPGSDAALCRGMPLMVGTVLNELANAVDDPAAAGFDDAALTRQARKAYGERGDAVVSAYKQSNPNRAPIELSNSMKASGIRTAAYDLAARKHSLDGKAWQYVFGWRTPMLEGRPMTFHSADIAFAFDNAGLCANQTGGGAEARELAGRVSDAWIAFARGGDPGHRGLPAWPTFDVQRPVMMLDRTCEIIRDFEGEGLRLIAQSEVTAGKAAA